MVKYWGRFKTSKIQTLFCCLIRVTFDRHFNNLALTIICSGRAGRTSHLGRSGGSGGLRHSGHSGRSGSKCGTRADLWHRNPLTIVLPPEPAGRLRGVFFATR